MKKILFITADFDENEMKSEFFDSLDHFVRDRTTWLSYEAMKDYIDQNGFDGEECEGPEQMIINLVKEGFHGDEWHAYELYEGTFTMGAVNV